MAEQRYKKMAGTAAVFVFAEGHDSAPVERDGMVWEGAELHIETMPAQLNEREPIASTLALEGLEEYDPPSHGDHRFVRALDSHFAYIGELRGWVEIRP